MTVTGIIFDVKRFAVHDGPGVRTTLFLKGCPLRCRWCHNPEGVGTQPVLAYHPGKCLHCGECISACSHGAHALVDGRHVFDRTRCVACGDCVAECLGLALRHYGREMSVDAARDIVLEDRDFYADGGGVTASGGEPLLQAEFCAELFRALKGGGVSCALDTSGAVDWECFETVLPHVDMVLYDLKHVDDDLHVACVGASNARILSNLVLLSERGVPIEVRIPLIPGFNLDDGSLRQIACFLAPLTNITAVRLLPYHPVRSKVEALGQADPMPGVEPPSAAQLAGAAACMSTVGLRVIGHAGTRSGYQTYHRGRGGRSGGG